MPIEAVTDPLIAPPTEIFVDGAGLNGLTDDAILLDASNAEHPFLYFRNAFAKHLDAEQCAEAENIILSQIFSGSTLMSKKVILHLKPPRRDVHLMLSLEQEPKWHAGLPVMFCPFLLRELRARSVGGSVVPENVRHQHMRVEVQNAVKVQVNLLHQLAMSHSTALMRFLQTEDETPESLIDRALKPMKSAFGLRKSEKKLHGDLEHGFWPSSLQRAAYDNAKEALQDRYGPLSVNKIRKAMSAEASKFSISQRASVWTQGLDQLRALMVLWRHVVSQEETRVERLKVVEKFKKAASDKNDRPDIRAPTLDGLMNNNPAQQMNKPSILSLTRMAYNLGVEEAVWAYPSLKFLQPLFRAATAAGRLARSSGSIELNEYRSCGGLYAIGYNKMMPDGFSNIDPELREAQSMLLNWMERDGLDALNLANAAGKAMFEKEGVTYENADFCPRFYMLT